MRTWSPLKGVRTDMYRLKKINLDEVWQKEQGWNAEKKSGRKYDDRIELEFW